MVEILGAFAVDYKIKAYMTKLKGRLQIDVYEAGVEFFCYCLFIQMLTDEDQLLHAVAELLVPVGVDTGVVGTELL